jgi:transcriptional antiterminator RfaH
VKSWYVVQTKPRLEILAEENLLRQEFEVYLPRCRVKRQRRGRWVSSIEPLFPRYLFMQVDLAETNTASVRSTKGVQGFVRFGGQPRAVPDELVEAICERADRESGFHDVGQHRFEAGQDVEVIDGPFAGLHAVYVSDDGDERVLLLFNLLGRESKVAVKRDTVVAAA